VRNTQRAIDAQSRLHAAAGAREIQPMAAGAPAWRDGDDLGRSIARWQRIPFAAGGFRLFCAHQMGTCRMGIDPATSGAGPWGEETIDVVNSSTEEVMGRIPQSTPADVDRAVAAARKAFDSWSTTELSERADLMRAIAGALAARADEIASTIAMELGMPIGL